MFKFKKILVRSVPREYLCNVKCGKISISFVIHHPHFSRLARFANLDRIEVMIIPQYGEKVRDVIILKFRAFYAIRNFIRNLLPRFLWIGFHCCDHAGQVTSSRTVFCWNVWHEAKMMKYFEGYGDGESHGPGDSLSWLAETLRVDPAEAHGFLCDSGSRFKAHLFVIKQYFKGEESED